MDWYCLDWRATKPSQVWLNGRWSQSTDKVQLDQHQRHSGLGQLSTPRHQMGQGYVNPKNINNKVSVSFSEGLSSAVSLHSSQLRTTLPGIKLPANSEEVKVLSQSRQEHIRHDIQAMDPSKLLTWKPVRLQELQTKTESTRREVLQDWDLQFTLWLKHQKVLVKEIGYTHQGSSNASTSQDNFCVWVAAKPPIPQSTAKHMAAAKPSTYQHTTPAVLTNKPIRSANEAFPNVQSDVP